MRQATIPVLMQMAHAGGVLALMQLLDDPHKDVQCDAVDALGKLHATRAIATLQRLLQCDDPDLSPRAAETLGKLGDQSGFRIARDYLVVDTPLNRRTARAIGAILGQPFHATAEGVASARCYLQAKKLIK